MARKINLSGVKLERYPKERQRGNEREKDREMINENVRSKRIETGVK